MGLNLSPLKTSFLAAVQVLAFKVGQNDKKMTFHILVNFLKPFSHLEVQCGNSKCYLEKKI